MYFTEIGGIFVNEYSLPLDLFRKLGNYKLVGNVAKFAKEKPLRALLIAFFLGFVSFILFAGIISSFGSSSSALAVLSPKSEESVSGLVPIRAYFKTKTEPFLLSAEYKVDDGISQMLPVTRVNDREVAAVGVWDSTIVPGKHTITITLFKSSKNGQKTVLAESKVPVAVLLFQ